MEGHLRLRKIKHGCVTLGKGLTGRPAAEGGITPDRAPDKIQRVFDNLPRNAVLYPYGGKPGRSFR